MRQNLASFKVAVRPLPRNVLVLRIPFRVSSSASGPVGYSPDEITDLTALLRKALRYASWSTESIAFDRALVELNKTSFAPRDWWQATYDKALKPVPLERHWLVSGPMLIEVYWLRRRLLKARWSPTTLADVKTKLKSSCYRSTKLFLSEP